MGPGAHPTNLDEMKKCLVRDELTGEDMANLWSTKELLVWDKRGVLICNHILNHFTFKSIIRLSKMVIFPKKLSKLITPPPL